MPAPPPQSAIRFLATSPSCSPSPLRSTRPWSPLRLTPPILRHEPLRYSRPFHTSRTLSAERTHYDVLGITPNASKADLKKRFYTLSKETHPDINPNNPDAAQRFSEVSEAYATLANEEKRRIYDRDVMPRFTRTSSAAINNRNRSGTYAGSRPATGLSTRRGTFRGPPPSFYSQGGQDSHPDPKEYARREQEAYDRGQAGAFDPSQYTNPGQWDSTFNPDPVYRTQTAEDRRRNSRREADENLARAIMEEQGDFWGRFIIVSAVVAFGVGIGTMVNRMGETPKGGLLRADGTRRGNLAADK